jgi:hypothetical protein
MTTWIRLLIALACLATMATGAGACPRMSCEHIPQDSAHGGHGN